MIICEHGVESTVTVSPGRIVGDAILQDVAQTYCMKCLALAFVKAWDRSNQQIERDGE